MLSIIGKFLWGSPTRRVVTVLFTVFIMPAWVFNYETWLEANGYNNLLTSDDSPLIGGLNSVLSFLISGNFRLLIIGAAIALADSSRPSS